MFKTDVFSQIEANDSKLFITTLFCDSMTKENILNSCKKNKLYVTPKLNDVLYLHYQGKIIHPKFEPRKKNNNFIFSIILICLPGYQKIENLDDYSELKCLWLECNAISEICGLDHQTKLRCLYLHNNFIRVSL